jgi:uncharacterized membrane protein YtjA (UPF0391 family)
MITSGLIFLAISLLCFLVGFHGNVAHSTRVFRILWLVSMVLFVGLTLSGLNHPA